MHLPADASVVIGANGLGHDMREPIRAALASFLPLGKDELACIAEIGNTLQVALVAWDERAYQVAYAHGSALRDEVERCARMATSSDVTVESDDDGFTRVGFGPRALLIRWIDGDTVIGSMSPQHLRNVAMRPSLSTDAAVSAIVAAIGGAGMWGLARGQPTRC